jgi:hypothetical protein
MPRCTLPAARFPPQVRDLGGVVGAAGQFAGGHRMLLRTGDGHAAERGFNTFGETERQRLWGGRQLRPAAGICCCR